MKKLFLGLVMLLTLIAFSNFALAGMTTETTYTQNTDEDKKCSSGKCGEGKCASGKCGGK